MKKVVSFLCSAFVALSLFGGSAVHAADTKTVQAEQGVKILGEYNGKQIVSVKKIVNGHWQAVSFDEFLKDMNTKTPAAAKQNPSVSSNEKSTPNSVISPEVYTWYSYWEDYGYYYNASPRKASTDYGCPYNAPTNCTLTLQYSLTQSKSANVSLSLPEWNAIKASLGYTYQETASVSDSYALPIPPGKYGHIEFAPKYHHSEGDMEAWMSFEVGVQMVGSEYVSIETPQKLSNGIMDGYALGVITNSPT